MKTIKTFILLSTAFLSLNMSANNTAEEAQKEIREKIHMDQSVCGSENKVEILFTTDEKGTVNFALAKTTNETLKKEIEKQFQTLHFNQLKKDAVNSVTLNFKTK